MSYNLDKYFKLEELKLPCVYFLIKRKKVVYIGSTYNLFVRMNNHPCIGLFDSIRIIRVEKDKLRGYERRLIIKFRPKLNIMFLLKIRPDIEDKKVTRNRTHLPKGRKFGKSYVISK